MLTKRIIPCLDVRGGRVVKGTNFTNLADMADPVEMARRYNREGADELVFYDITAGAEGRPLFTEMLERTAKEVFIPLTAGGGINAVSDFELVLNSGADKVSVNSGALKNPSLIDEAARIYGSQCVVLSIDVKRVNGQFRVFATGGREDTGRDALEWVKEGTQRGAGEIVVNSIDADGVRGGFDLEMLAAIASVTDLPIIASGGAGNMEHFQTLFNLPYVDAGLAAGIFHEGLVRIGDLKSFLRSRAVNVRHSEAALTFAPYDIAKDRAFLKAAHKETFELTFHAEFREDLFAEELAKDKAVRDGAYLNGQLVGICDLVRRGAENGGDRGHVSFFFIAPEHRGKGLGGQLVLHAADWCRQCALKTLTLRTGRGNRAAQRCYEKTGFTRAPRLDTEAELGYAKAID